MKSASLPLLVNDTNNDTYHQNNKKKNNNNENNNDKGSIDINDNNNNNSTNKSVSDPHCYQLMSDQGTYTKQQQNDNVDGDDLEGTNEHQDQEEEVNPRGIVRRIPSASSSSSSSTTTDIVQQVLPENKQLSIFDATIHLLKGNLGPGCLNLPHAFALTGYGLGSILFLIVAAQGIYTMWLLVECKTWLVLQRQQQQQQQVVVTANETATAANSSTSSNNTNTNTTISSCHATTTTTIAETTGTRVVVATQLQPQPSPMTSATTTTTIARQLPSSEEEEEGHIHHHHHSNNNNNNTKQWTFMTVAHLALGSNGGHIVEILLFLVQTGVCCVFVSLLSTNLQAATATTSLVVVSNTVAVSIVTIVLLGIVLLRFIKDLLWLSMTANLCMILAIMTASITGIIVTIQRQQQQYQHDQNENHDPNDHDHNDDVAVVVWANFSPSAMILFTADLFYAFEGIGLVLPIENSFNTHNNGTPSSSSNQQQRHQQSNRSSSSSSSSSLSFQYVLLRAMSITAFLFLFIGITASIGFPNIHTGSVTAYLQIQYPTIVWFEIINYLVMIAVAFTFPLQLTPAMEVIDGWLDNYNRKQQNNNINNNHPDHHHHQDQQERNSTHNGSLCGCVRRYWNYRNRQELELIPTHEEEVGGGGEVQAQVEDPLQQQCHGDAAAAAAASGVSDDVFLDEHVESSSNNKDGNHIPTTNDHNDNNPPTGSCSTRRDGSGTILPPTQQEQQQQWNNRNNNNSMTCCGSGCGPYEWIFRRWAMVFLCSTIVMLVQNNLGILMSLFGSVAQTGLAAMPCVIDLSIQRQQQQQQQQQNMALSSPESSSSQYHHPHHHRWWWQQGLNYIIIAFCSMVMMTGLVESLRELIV